MSVQLRTIKDAVLGHSGRFHVYIYASQRVIKYWLIVIKLPCHRRVRKGYDMLKLYDGLGHSNWVTQIRTNLTKNEWNDHSDTNESKFICIYLQRLKYQYVQKWRERCYSSSKLSCISILSQILISRII